MDTDSREPQPPTTFALTPATRHDGWSGEKMAKFCETLAETAVVADACDEVGMHVSGAYALRRRNPVFAAGWDAALTIARERLADTLLARAMEGNTELIYRDGEIVGRRDVLDNRLGLAILRRLDRLAETGRATVAARVEPAAEQRSAHAPAIISGEIDWTLMLDALRSGHPDDIAGALAVLKSTEVDEVEDPPNSLIEDDSDSLANLAERCWFDEADELWMTDFPPPEGFDGYEEGEWHEFGYKRACTAEEAALLEADQAAAHAVEMGEDAELRERWFDMLADGLERPGDEGEKPEED
jgi:hypothetical protein